MPVLEQISSSLRISGEAHLGKALDFEEKGLSSPITYGYQDKTLAYIPTSVLQNHTLTNCEGEKILYSINIQRILIKDSKSFIFFSIFFFKRLVHL